jgi:hypothetical protein
MGILLILLAILAMFLLWSVAGHGVLITSRNGCRDALAPIDVRLRRRFDPAPDLAVTTPHPGDRAGMREASKVRF